MRFLSLACFAAGVSACSLLLDTESLQKKAAAVGTAGAAGAGGSTGGAGGQDAGGARDAGGDVTPAEAGKSCESAADCLPGVDINGCDLYVCGADKTCQPPVPNKGKLGVVAVGSIETVMSANEIGYPSLLADGSDFVMGVWHRNGTTTDVLIRKYPAYPSGPAGAELSAIAPGAFRAYGSSPGLITRVPAPRKVRLLLAADRLGDAAPNVAMHLVDIDVPLANNNLKLSAMQPTMPDLGVSQYDTKPRAFPPKLLPNGLQEPSGMWIQQQKLYYFDGSSAPVEAFSAKRVLGFAPLAGGGVHAALQTAELGAANGVERTELWSKDSNVLVSLDGDMPASRRGVTATSTNESGLTANLVGWSFDPSGIPSLTYAAAVCAGTSCSSVALSMQSAAVLYASYPEMTSNRVAGSMVDRDILQTFQVTFAEPDHVTMADTVLYAGASRFTIPSVDLAKSSSTEMNPPLFRVDAVTASAAVAGSDVLGPSSVAITSDGNIIIAWVVHPSANMAILKARRYVVKTCD